MMNIRFVLFDNEELLNRNDIELTMVERYDDNLSYNSYHVLMAKVESKDDIKIKLPDGSIQSIDTIIERDGFYDVTKWKYNHLTL